jgi:hypothetical protein
MNEKSNENIKNEKIIENTTNVVPDRAGTISLSGIEEKKIKMATLWLFGPMAPILEKLPEVNVKIEGSLILSEGLKRLSTITGISKMAPPMVGLAVGGAMVKGLKAVGGSPSQKIGAAIVTGTITTGSILELLTVI